MTKIVALLFLGILIGVYEARAQATVDCGQSIQPEARNKATVINLINEMYGDKDVDAADKYISAEKYTQHNPLVGDGIQAIKTSAMQWFIGAEKEKIQIARISAEGDLVWAHFKMNFLGQDMAVVDINRFENGKIVEHWDVMQPMPEKSANDHPMF